MQKLLFIVLTSLLFFTACKNEPVPKGEDGAVSVPVKTEKAKATAPPANPASEEATVEKEDSDKPSFDEADAVIGTRTEVHQKSTEKPSPEISPKKEEKKVEKPKAETRQDPSKTEPAPPAKTPQTTEKQPLEKKPTVVEKAPEKPQPPSHSAWDGLLRKYVNGSGKVNYSGLKSEVAKLDAYLEILEKNAPEPDWSRKEKLAYWINAYNAFTVKLIVDNYPVGSITDLEGGKPWDKKWIHIGGKTYSLNNLENDIIRPRFHEPRIHFAVNCAAKSCPPLLNRAWTAANLNGNLEKRAKAFINNPNYNSIAADKVKVSKIFDWYGSDFGNLIGFLSKYGETRISANAKVECGEYNWALNK